MTTKALFAMLLCLWALAGCEQLGIPDPAREAAAAADEGKAIGAACRHSGEPWKTATRSTLVRQSRCIRRLAVDERLHGGKQARNRAPTLPPTTMALPSRKPQAENHADAEKDGRRSASGGKGKPHRTRSLDACTRPTQVTSTLVRSGKSGAIPGDELVERHGPREQVPATDRTPIPPGPPVSLHPRPLRDNAQAETMAESNHRIDDRTITFRAIELAHEQLVDLELRDRQVSEGRPVTRNPYRSRRVQRRNRAPQTYDHLTHPHLVGEQCSLGNLERKLRGIHAPGAQALADQVGQFLVAHVGAVRFRDRRNAMPWR